MGRPKRTLSTKDREVVRELLEKHCSMTQIAKALRMFYGTFKRLLAEDKELQEVVDEVLESERADLHGVLYDVAIKERNIIACMFLLKARHNYRDAGPVADVNVAGNIIMLPAPATPEQYANLLSHANGASNATSAALGASRALPEPVEVSRG